MTNIYLKKLMALVLSFALCLSMLPVSLAAEVSGEGRLTTSAIVEPDEVVDPIEPEEEQDSDCSDTARIDERYILNLPDTHEGAAPLDDSITEDTVLNIMDYGAKPNDQKSDTLGIQTALDLAANTGATVYVPEGTWYITDPALISSHFTLKLDSNAVIKRHPSTPDIFMMLPKPTWDISEGAQVGYSGFTDVTIMGGTWDGNTDGDHPQNMVYLYHGSDVHFEDVVFTHASGHHFLELAGVKDATVTGCTFKDFIKCSYVDYDETVIPNTPGDPSRSSEAIQLDYTSGETSGNSMPYDYTPCQNITISGCTFRNCLTGIGNHHADAPSTNIQVLNCTFQDLYYCCFNMEGFKDFLLQNNTAQNVRRFLKAAQGSVGVAKDNTCAYGSASPNTTAMFWVSNAAVDLINNVVESSSSHGIYMTNLPAPVKLENNTVNVAASSSAAVRLVGCGSTVTVSNTGTPEEHPLSSKASNTISVQNTTVNLQKLYIPASGSNGIYLTNATTTVTSSITDCNIRSSKNSAITATGATAKVKLLRNTLYSCPGRKDTSGALISGYGICATSGAYISASENNINKMGLHGVYTQASTATLTSNKIYTTGKEGVFITGGSTSNMTSNQIGTNANTTSVPGSAGVYAENSTVNLKTNSLYNCKAGGIRLYKLKAAATVSSNKLTGIIGDGITVSSCTKKVTMSANTVTSPTGNAINAASSYLSATDNIIKTPGKNGIALTKCASIQSAVNTNTITSPKNTGIRLENSWVSAASNTVSKPAATGIFVTGASSKGTVTKNTVSGSGSHSIYLSGCSTNAITVSYNKISAAKGDSIRALSSRASITYNTITTPGANGIYLTKCSAASVPVSYNKVTAAVGDGIRVSESNATVNNNTVTSTTKNGIYILTASTAAVKANTVTKSKGYDILFAKGCKGSILDNRVTTTSKISNPAKVTCKGNKKA